MAPSVLSEEALRLAAEERAAGLSQELARVRAFVARSDRALDEEHRRLAREVHGQLGQVGPTIKMLAITLQGQLPPALESLLEDIQLLAEEASRSTHTICAALRPPLLDELGLAPALEHQLELLTGRTGVSTQAMLQDTRMLSSASASALFRISREAWQQLLLPMGSKALHVQGQQVAEDKRQGYAMEIIGSGEGTHFDAGLAEASGLPDLKERALNFGGRFEFTTLEDGRLRVFAWLPLEVTA
jgi:signal transduction histidine kinase